MSDVKVVEGIRVDGDSVVQLTRSEYERLVAASPQGAQPIYDEAKERELFEQGYHHSALTRDGDDYIRMSVQLTWEGWEKCAQSRAKAGEVGHE